MEQISIANILDALQDKEHYHMTLIDTVKDNPFLKNGDYACVLEFNTFDKMDKTKYIHDGSIVKYELNISGHTEIALLRVGQYKTEIVLYPFSRNIQIDPILIKNTDINTSHITGVLMFSIHDFSNLLAIQ
ncbi:hypothetical protein [Lentilactobacillus sunkii]|jgi:hypothetical protein|uniref:Uncharacterized protein n=1 Tax=Lentilactobacillus sunkii DSM 19904 TaxID=1423808 RepID=A0A0R1KVV1_9LACO|nr:hypothetical protein [Lentilactobacillus sunkii]KRK87525.1 hypothetical protein FD17_GL000922 [Lentilactobacillus sunkii DSM 19904]